MCPKKAKKKLTTVQMIDALCGLWILYRAGVLDKWLKKHADAEEPSDRNTTSSASNVGKRGKEKSVNKGKSVRQSETH